MNTTDKPAQELPKIPILPEKPQPVYNSIDEFLVDLIRFGYKLGHTEIEVGNGALIYVSLHVAKVESVHDSFNISFDFKSQKNKFDCTHQILMSQNYFKGSLNKESESQFIIANSFLQNCKFCKSQIKNLVEVSDNKYRLNVSDIYEVEDDG